MIQRNTETASPSEKSVVTEQASKMDPALKAKWVEALRSGEYKQRRYYFERDGMNCCLGVLCKVAGQPAERSHGEYAEDNWPFVDHTVGSSFHVAALIELNDEERKTFPEIADYIEANL